MANNSSIKAEIAFTPEHLRKLNNLNKAVQDTAQMVIPDFDAFNYQIQTFTIPSVNIPGVETPYLGNQTSVIGDSVVYGELTVDFYVDEDLQNYIALLEYAQLIAHQDDVPNRYFDLQIFWKNRNNSVTKIITLHGAYLVDIGSITIAANNTAQDALICTTSFKGQYLTIRSANPSTDNIQTSHNMNNEGDNG